MIFAEVSSGRSDFDSSSPTKAEMPGSAAAAAVLDRRGAAARARRLEGRGAHRDHLGLVLRAHGLHRVAGIDQPLEGIGRDHLDDVGDLHDVEQGRDARHDVLARGGRRRDDGIVSSRQRADERRHRLGQHVLVSRRRRRAEPCFTPSSLAAASATGRQSLPATSTCTGCPSALAAVSALWVASLSVLLSCSARRSVVMSAAHRCYPRAGG